MIREAQELVDLAIPLLGKIRLSRPDMCAATVAAALRTSTGNTYTGVCVHVSCGLGFCAEHAAIAEMIKGRETRIEIIVAVGEDHAIMSPCGRCREFMVQVDSHNLDARIVLDRDRIVRLRELLPDHWLSAGD